MMLLGDAFNPLNDPEGGFEGVNGGTWDYAIRAKINRANTTPEREQTTWHLFLYSQNGTFGRISSFDLSTAKNFLFEIKTLNPSAPPGTLYLNIKNGFEQAIRNASANTKGYSILVVDQQAYQSMYNSITPSQKAIINDLFGQLDKKNEGQGGLWLIDGLEDRAKKLATKAYHDVKNNTSKETNCVDEKPQ